MNREQLNELSDFIPIISRINRKLFQGLPFDDGCPIPHAQMQSLIMIKKFQTVNMTQLAENLMMTRQQLTKVIDALVAKELVNRKTDPDNRRHVLLELSEKGDEYLDALFFGENGVITKLNNVLDSENKQKFILAIKLFTEALSSIE